MAELPDRGRKTSRGEYYGKVSPIPKIKKMKEKGLYDCMIANVHQPYSLVNIPISIFLTY
jgi:hypothetical protein